MSEIILSKRARSAGRPFTFTNPAIPHIRFGAEKCNWSAKGICGFRLTAKGLTLNSVSLRGEIGYRAGLTTIATRIVPLIYHMTELFCPRATLEIRVGRTKSQVLCANENKVLLVAF